MKKLFIPLFAVVFATTVNAEEVAPVVNATEVTPVVAAATTEVSVAPVAQVSKTESYAQIAKNAAYKYVGQYVEAHPYYAMAATVVLTAVVVKAVDYATESNEDDEF